MPDTHQPRPSSEVLDEERTRFAAMLHDGVAQSLTALAFSTRLLWDDLRTADARGTAETRAIVAEVEACARQVRAISRVLAPRTLLREGLAAAIAEYSHCLPAHLQARLSVRVNEPNLVLPDAAAGRCFGIACELIGIALEGRGNPVLVVVRREGSDFRMAVDAGCLDAFPPAGALPVGVAQRAHALGARIEVSPRRDRVSVGFSSPEAA